MKRMQPSFETEKASEGSEKKKLLEQDLDNLLERYLVLLDQYQTKHAELSNHLATVDNSLASIVSEKNLLIHFHRVICH